MHRAPSSCSRILIRAARLLLALRARWNTTREKALEALIQMNSVSKINVYILWITKFWWFKKYYQILLLVIMYSGIFNLFSTQEYCLLARNTQSFVGANSERGSQRSREDINPQCITPLQYLHADVYASYCTHKVSHPFFMESLASSHFFLQASQAVLRMQPMGWKFTP